MHGFLSKLEATGRVIAHSAYLVGRGLWNCPREHQIFEKHQLQNSEGLVRQQSVSWAAFSSRGLNEEESTFKLTLVIGRIYFPAAAACKSRLLAGHWQEAAQSSLTHGLF